jgi:hypothetical protein
LAGLAQDSAQQVAPSAAAAGCPATAAQKPAEQRTDAAQHPFSPAAQGGRRVDRIGPLEPAGRPGHLFYQRLKLGRGMLLCQLHESPHAGLGLGRVDAELRGQLIDDIVHGPVLLSSPPAIRVVDDS